MCVTAVRVDFGRPEASFNESDGIYTMCIVKNTTTAQRVTVELSNTPGTALLDEGRFLWFVMKIHAFSSFHVLNRLSFSDTKTDIN